MTYSQNFANPFIIRPQRIVNALNVMILPMTYKLTLGFAVISDLNPEILYAKSFAQLVIVIYILYLSFFSDL